MTDARAPLPDGGALAYALHGDPGHPALLLVRPLGGTTSLWGPFREALAARFRVVSFDHRGVGRSSAARVPTTTRSLARDALALLDHLGLASAHVFGLSLGGMAATWLAAEAPSRVARLVLASTLARGAALTVEGVVRGVSLARSLRRDPVETEVALVRRMLSSRFRRARPDAVEAILAKVRAAPASHATLAALLGAAALHDARAALGRIRAPTLVLAGEHDPLLGAVNPLALGNAIPGARFETIPDAGHDLTLEQPAITAERVTSFMLEGEPGPQAEPRR